MSETHNKSVKTHLIQDINSLNSGNGLDLLADVSLNSIQYTTESLSNTESIMNIPSFNSTSIENQRIPHILCGCYSKPITIGRAEHSTLKLDGNKRISRFHAEIVWNRSLLSFELHIFGYNGLKVNGVYFGNSHHPIILV